MTKSLIVAIAGFLLRAAAIANAQTITEKQPLFHTSSGASVYNTPISGGLIQLLDGSIKVFNADSDPDVEDDLPVSEVEVDISKLISLNGDLIDIDLGEGPIQFLRDDRTTHGDGTATRTRRRKLRRVQEYTPEVKMDKLEDILECQLDGTCNDNSDYLPPNGIFDPEDPSQKFQYFEGKALFQQAEATVYVKSMIHPGGVEGEDGIRYLSGIILTQRYEYIFRGDPQTGKTFLVQLDPETFPSMPPPINPEDEIDAEMDEESARKLKAELRQEDGQLTKMVEADRKRKRRLGEQGRNLQNDNGSVLDIMVVYTKNSLCQANNQAYPCDDINPAQHLNIINTAEASVAQTNQAYINSGINTQLRLVYVHYSDNIDDRGYTCSSILGAFTSKTDGVMDEVHQKRTEWGADFVALLPSTAVSGCGGIAYLGPWSSYMFSVTIWKYSVGGTFAHELGHNYGCEHDRLNGNPGKPYEYGWQDPEAKFRTIMAYNCPTKYCPRINYFSNPVYRYDGKIMGNESNDCARRHNEVKEKIALYYKARLTNSPTVSPAPSISTAPSVSPTGVPTPAPTISRSPSSAPSVSIAPSSMPSEYPTFDIASLEDFQRLQSPGTTAFQVQHGIMFDIEAKDHDVTIRNFRIPFLRAAERVTISIWTKDGPFWYEKNNPDAWKLIGSPVAYSPGITLEDPVPLPLRGGTEYGFEPIFLKAGTKTGIYILVNRTTTEDDNLIGMDSRSATSCSSYAISPFKFLTWFEDDNIAVSQGIYKEDWMTSVGSAFDSFNFIGSIYYESEGSSSVGLPAPSAKPSMAPSLSLVPSTSLQPSGSAFLEVTSPLAINVAAVDGLMIDVFAKDQNILINSLSLVIYSVTPQLADNLVSLAVFSRPDTFFNESVGDSYERVTWTPQGTTQIAASSTLQAVPLPENTFDPIFVKQGTSVALYISIIDPLRNHKILAREGSTLLSKDFENANVAIKQGAALQWETCESWGFTLTDTNGSPVPYGLLGKLLYSQAGTSEPTSMPSALPSFAPSLSAHPSVSLAPSLTPSLSLEPSTSPSSAPSLSLNPSFSPSTTERPTYDTLTLLTPDDEDNDGSSAFGLMFDIKAMKPVEIQSFSLSSMQTYPMDIIIYSRKGSHYYAYDDEAEWETIARYSNFTGGGKLTIPPVSCPVNSPVAFYVAIVNTFGESWPLLGSFLPGSNYRDGVWASDDHIQLMEGVKFFGISEDWPFGKGTFDSGVYMLQGPGGTSFNMKKSLIEYRVIDTILPSMSPSTSSAPSVSLVPSSAPTESSQPSSAPSVSFKPSSKPSSAPSLSAQPSSVPSSKPTSSPSVSEMPSLVPSVSSQPSSKPSSRPSSKPSTSPSAMPSVSSQPSSLPSSSPSSVPSISTQPSYSPSVSMMPTADRVKLTSYGSGKLNGAFGVMFEVAANRAITIETFHVSIGSNSNRYAFHVYTKPGFLGVSSLNDANVWTKIGQFNYASLSSSNNPVRFPSRDMDSVRINAGATQSFYIACVGNYFMVNEATSSETTSNGDANIRAGFRKYPYDTLFQNGNQQYYLFRGALVYSYAVEAPSTSPSVLPSVAPSLSGKPTFISGKPSTSPTLSSAPSSSPSAKPTTLAPTKDPFKEAHIEIKIPAKISLSGFNIPQTQVELQTVVTILATTLKNAFSTNLLTSQRVTAVNIISINGVLVSSGTTLRNRLLESRNLEVAIIDYEVLLEEICSTSSCDDAEAAAADLYEKATDTMKTEIDSGRFASAVRDAASASNVIALLDIAVESSDFSEVVLTLLGVLSTFYPDWENGGYCKNDGGEPIYMQYAADIWLTGSKIACCLKYFNYAYNHCMGAAATALGYYPAWAHSSNDSKCLMDNKVPDYMRQSPGVWIYNDVSACCKRYYDYAYDDCVTASGGTATAAVSKWYPSWANEGDDVKCIFDTNAPNYMKKEAGSWLYDDMSKCCERYYGYSMNECLLESGGSSAALASQKWYVDWKKEVCVKDCDDSADPSCGGLAQSWDELFDESDDCCKKKLSWVPRKQHSLMFLTNNGASGIRFFVKLYRIKQYIYSRYNFSMKKD